jgi:hypothetical protein
VNDRDRDTVKFLISAVAVIVTAVVIVWLLAHLVPEECG